MCVSNKKINQSTLILNHRVLVRATLVPVKNEFPDFYTTYYFNNCIYTILTSSSLISPSFLSSSFFVSFLSVLVLSLVILMWNESFPQLRVPRHKFVDVGRQLLMDPRHSSHCQRKYTKSNDFLPLILQLTVDYINIENSLVHD